MKIALLGAAAVAGALSIISVQTPAVAASVATNEFLNNAVPNVDFLDRSARFALTNSKNARIKGFAESEAREQTLAANKMDEWISADTAAREVMASAATQEVQTGRSVAIDGPVPATGTPSDVDGRSIPADPRLAMGQEDLDFMEGLTGADFDRAFKERQVNALEQLQTDYRKYLAQGDDPTLLAIAKRELPKVTARLQAIARL